MIGDIILMKNKSGGIFPAAIRFFTGRLAKRSKVEAFTHSCYSVGKVFGVESVLSAELAMCVMPLHKFRTDKFYFEVYRLKDTYKEGVKSYRLISLIGKHYKKSAGEPYGFFQNLWFIYRAIMELLGFNMVGKKNWFPNNENCSESTANYLIDRWKNLCNPNTALIDLMRYNTNSIHPVDLAIIRKRNPELFELVEVWGSP